jgi:hypothetical protein
MKKIKLNVKMEWFYTQEPELHILKYFKNRKIKKNLKIALKDISKTLNIYDWNVIINIRSMYEDEPMEYSIRIELKSKINNISGSIKFANISKLLSKEEKTPIRFLKDFHYIHKNNIFFNTLVSNKETIFLTLYNIREYRESFVYYPPIDNKEITQFKNKHEDFLKHLNNDHNFDLVESKECASQVFYVCDKIYWSTSYVLPSGNYERDCNNGFSNIRNITENDTKTLLCAMIEGEIINITQDVEEVLLCDIKDILAMSELIGY